MTFWAFVSLAKFLLPLLLLFLPHKTWLRSARGWWRRKRRPSLRNEARRIASEYRLVWRLKSNSGRLIALAVRNLLGGLGLFGIAGFYHFLLRVDPLASDPFVILFTDLVTLGPVSAGIFVFGYNWRFFAAVSGRVAESRLYLRPLRQHLARLGVPPEQIELRLAKLRSGRGDPLGKLVDKERGVIAPSLRVVGERRK